MGIPNTLQMSSLRKAACSQESVNGFQATVSIETGAAQNECAIQGVEMLKASLREGNGH